MSYPDGPSRDAEETAVSMPRSTYDQIGTAYRQMAERARYRPAAPSDGMGSITVPEEDLDLAREEHDYATGWGAGQGLRQAEGSMAGRPSSRQGGQGRASEDRPMES